jgi:dimethylargininase
MAAMPFAITRRVGPAIVDCQLEYLSRQAIDWKKAQGQHLEYERALESAGYRIISMPADPNLPDGVFVEDCAVVVDEVGVLTRPAAEARRAEVESIALALQPFRRLLRIEAPATLEGGDVLRVGRRLFVGHSRRTNDDGIEQLRRHLSPFGYEVVAVEVTGCLHLKSACCAIGHDRLLLNREWVDPAGFTGFDLVDVPEAWGANVLLLGETVVVSTAFPKTQQMLQSLGLRVVGIDNSELRKAEAGVTCSSLLFDTPGDYDKES